MNQKSAQVYRIAYLSTLELTSEASLKDVKHAYRKLARRYHPDLNSNPDASEKFIEITEAYDYLLKYFNSCEGYSNLRQADLERNWNAGQREQARAKARRYAGGKYSSFRRTKYYRGTIVAERLHIYFNLAISLLIFFVSIHGFIVQSQLTTVDEDPPSVTRFIFFLFIGLLFLSVSLLYLISSYKNHRKNQKT